MQAVPGTVDLGRLDSVNGERIGAGWVCRRGGLPTARRCAWIPTMTSPDTRVGSPSCSANLRSALRPD